MTSDHEPFPGTSSAIPASICQAGPAALVDIPFSSSSRDKASLLRPQLCQDPCDQAQSHEERQEGFGGKDTSPCKAPALHEVCPWYAGSGSVLNPGNKDGATLPVPRAQGIKFIHKKAPPQVSGFHFFPNEVLTLADEMGYYDSYNEFLKWSLPLICSHYSYCVSRCVCPSAWSLS